MSIAINVQKYGATFDLVLGVLGNVFSVIVLLRKRMRVLPSSFYLLVLSATDLLFTIMSPGLRYFTNAFWPSVDLLVRASWYCRFWYIFSQTLSTFSNWIVAAITAERSVAVCLPLYAKRILRRRNGQIYLVCCFVLILGYFVYSTSKFEVVSTQRGSRCTIPPKSVDYFVKTIRRWVQFVLGTCVPLVVILTCNTVIIHYMRRSRSIKYNSTHNDTMKQTRALVSTLLTVSFAYIVLTIPLRTAWIILVTTQSPDVLVTAFGVVMIGLNHSINFCLYMVAGSAFRRELFAMVKEGIGWCATQSPLSPPQKKEDTSNATGETSQAPGSGSLGK